MILPSCSVTTTLAAIFIVMLRTYSLVVVDCTLERKVLYEKKFEMVFSLFNQYAITNILINIKAATIDMIYDDVFAPSHIIIYEEQNSIFVSTQHSQNPEPRVSHKIKHKHTIIIIFVPGLI